MPAAVGSQPSISRRISKANVPFLFLILPHISVILCREDAQRRQSPRSRTHRRRAEHAFYYFEWRTAVPDEPIDPATLQGDALRRWYLRSPTDIEQERQAAATRRYQEYFGGYPGTDPGPGSDRGFETSGPDIDPGFGRELAPAERNVDPGFSRIPESSGLNPGGRAQSTLDAPAAEPTDDISPVPIQLVDASELLLRPRLALAANPEVDRLSRFIKLRALTLLPSEGHRQVAGWRR